MGTIRQNEAEYRPQNGWAEEEQSQNRAPGAVCDHAPSILQTLNA